MEKEESRTAATIQVVEQRLTKSEKKIKEGICSDKLIRFYLYQREMYTFCKIYFHLDLLLPNLGI